MRDYMKCGIAVMMVAAGINCAGCVPAGGEEDLTAPPFPTLEELVEANDAPTAAAGDDITISANQTVSLDGTGSTDPDGDRLGFFWRQVSGTPTIELQDAFSSRPTFVAPAVDDATAFTFRLTVTDGLVSVSDDIVITVNP